MGRITVFFLFLLLPTASLGQTSQPAPQRLDSWGKIVYLSTPGAVYDGGLVGGSPVHGIVLAAPRITLRNLEVGFNRSSGIKLAYDATDCTIEHCIVWHNRLQGIEGHSASDRVDRLTVRYCRIEANGINPQDHGIYADGAGLTLLSNIIDHNAGWGITLYPRASGVQVVGNYVWDNNSGQIYVSAPEGGAGSRIYANQTAGRYGVMIGGAPTSQPHDASMNNATVTIENGARPTVVQRYNYVQKWTPLAPASQPN